MIQLILVKINITAPIIFIIIVNIVLVLMFVCEVSLGNTYYIFLQFMSKIRARDGLMIELL